LLLKTGARVDFASANIEDDAVAFAPVGPEGIPYTDVVGSSDFDRDFGLLSFYLTAEYAANPCWTYSAGAGYAERAPILTEFYAAGPFMFLLQNGLNTVTGDPRLDKERLGQIDVALRYNNGRVRSGLSGYYAWINDYITFEAMQVATAPPQGQIEQVSLKFVNTDLATLSGFEYFAEYDVNPWLMAFSTLSYVEGRDHTRIGNFATRPATPVAPSVRVPGLPRGAFSGIPGAAEEPLPMIRPLESRIGVRLHEPFDNALWSVELSVRIADQQDRVATSLLESPTPGFSVWDIRSYWQASDSLQLVAGVENFSNKNYQEYLDFRPLGPGALPVFQPGVNFYFGGELTY
jgi:outer membrane receptor protein involved in Fe transport